MQLKKYVGQDVSVMTLAANGYRSWVEKTGEITVTQRESIEDNSIEGTAVDASPDSLTVEYDHRGRTYRYEISSSAIAWIATSALNETGKAQSERMKAQHAEAAKK